MSTLGDFAVDGFFILSGFLVTRSYLKLDSIYRFVWHRFLRIMPGFWVCLLVTGLVVAPVAALLEGGSAAAPFTTDPSAFRYIVSNSGLLILQYDIGGVLAGNPTPLVFNGSLWTLALEGLCYLLVAALGVAGALRHRPVLVPIAAAVVWALTIAYDLGANVLVGDETLRMVFVFLLGATAHLYAHRVPMSGWLAVAAAVLFLLSAATLENYRLVGALPLAYLLLWIGACFPWPLSLPADLSYGVYIYHWPILQLIAATGLVELPGLAFVTVGLLCVLPVAALSWFLVEKPALARKHNAVPDRVESAARRAWTAVGRQRETAQRRP